MRTDRLSFIVRLWQEDGSPGSSDGPWRGQVSSVPDGKPSYASAPDEVPLLLAREIDRCGVPLGRGWRSWLRIREWLKRTRSRP